MLAPNQFLYVDGTKIINFDNNEDARSLYKWYRCHKHNRYNKRKFVDGALYTSIFMDSADVIQPKPGCLIELEALMVDTGDTTTVYITCDVNISNSYLLCLNELGAILMDKAPNTNRQKKKDGGCVYILGSGKKGNGTKGTYNLTNSSDNLITAMSNITMEAESYYKSIGLSQDIEEMKQSCVHEKLCNNKFFVSSIIQSRNLINAAHIDNTDSSPSISTWTEPTIDSCSEWYFILPNTTRDGKKAILIALRHGVSIRWDGRKLFHCSTVSNGYCGGNVYGTYFGTK